MAMRYSPRAGERRVQLLPLRRLDDALQARGAQRAAALHPGQARHAPPLLHGRGRMPPPPAQGMRADALIVTVTVTVTLALALTPTLTPTLALALTLTRSSLYSRAPSTTASPPPSWRHSVRARARVGARVRARVRANQSMKQGRCSHSAPQVAAPVLQPKTSAKKLLACDRVNA